MFYGGHMTIASVRCWLSSRRDAGDGGVGGWLVHSWLHCCITQRRVLSLCTTCVKEWWAGFDNDGLCFGLRLRSGGQPQEQYASCAFHNTTGRGMFGDALAEVDWLVDTLVKKLDALDLLENTLILFTGDNGEVPTRGVPTLHRHHGDNRLVLGS